jgi:subtilisin-like proprotein convertase family protein
MAVLAIVVVALTATPAASQDEDSKAEEGAVTEQAPTPEPAQPAPVASDGTYPPAQASTPVPPPSVAEVTAAAVQTFSTGTISVAIPDSPGGPIFVPLQVGGFGAIADVNASIRINHTFDADLDIFLIHPDGTRIELSTDNGGGSDNFGTGAGCLGTLTTFDDEAATSITAGIAPFAGAFRPEGVLGSLDGKQAAGIWQLEVKDDFGIDIGTVLCFEVTVDVGPPSSSIVNGSFEVGQAVAAPWGSFAGWNVEDLTIPFWPINQAPAASTPGFSLFATVPTDGSFVLEHGFDGNGPGTIEVWQDVTLPAGGPRLDFDWRAGWDLTLGIPPAAIDRKLDVVIEPAGGGAPLATTNILTTDFAGTPIVLDTGPKTAAVDLSAFAGMSVRINLVATVPEANTGPAHMQFDNVRLVQLPGAPISPVATAFDSQVTVSWGAPNPGGSPITGYTVTATPGGKTCTTTGALSCVVTGLTNNIAYTFAVTATNALGTGPAAMVGPATPVPYQSRIYVANRIASGPADYSFPFGTLTSQVVAGDWDGNGADGFGSRTGNVYTLVDERGNPFKTVGYGKPTDTTLVGDWNANGTDTLAARRGNIYYLKNTIAPGNADIVLGYGQAADEVFVGDWNGNGQDTFAVRRGNVFYVRNSTTTGVADIVFGYGKAGDEVLVGDWNQDGIDTFAVRRGNMIFIRNDFQPGPATTLIAYGKASDQLLVGDWNNDGVDTFSVRRIEPK